MPFIRICAVALVILFALPAPAEAIINIEDERIALPEDGLDGRVSLALKGASGNTEKFGIETGARLQWQQGDRVELLLLNYAFGKSRGVRDTNKAFAHLRHRQQFRSVLAWEFFLQVQKDEFARLARRELAGVGLRFGFLQDSEKSAAYLGLGAFFEHERLSVLAGTTDPLSSRLWRANSYLTLKHAFNDRVRLLSVTYYQPALSDFADFRLFEDFGFFVGLTDSLDMKFGLGLRFDSKPPQQVRSRDASYSTSLEYRF